MQFLKIRRQLPNARERILLFCLGAALGTLGDLSHVLSGTLAYPQSALRPDSLPVPLWVPIEFGLAAVGLADLNVIVRAFYPNSLALKPSLRSVTGSAALFLSIYFSSGFLPLPTGGARDAVLAIFAIFCWFAFDRSLPGIVAGIIAGALGVAVECALARAGIFGYFPHLVNFFFVPSWLPWLYLAASATTAHFARFLHSLRENRPL